MNDKTFAAIDFETANRSRTSACAIGVAIVQGARTIWSERHLICPPTAEFEFTYIHGLTWAHVCNQKRFSEVWAALAPSLKHVDYFAAHNAPFDRSVLEACCRHHGMAVPNTPFVDTVMVARKLWNLRPTRLPDVCQFLGIELNHHDALSDAKACAEIIAAAIDQGWRP